MPSSNPNTNLLTYSPQGPRRRRRSTVIVISAIFICFCSVLFFRREIRREIESLALQYRISKLMPQRIIVRSSDPDDVGTLRGKRDYGFNRARNQSYWCPDCRGDLIRRTEGYPSEKGSYTPFVGPRSMIALTIRRVRGGPRRIVLIEESDPGAFRWYVIGLGTWTEPPTFLSGGLAIDSRTLHILWMATTVDSKDSRHLRIDFNAGSQPDWWDVLLEEDDTISMSDRFGRKLKQHP